MRGREERRAVCVCVCVFVPVLEGLVRDWRMEGRAEVEDVCVCVCVCALLSSVTAVESCWTYSSRRVRRHGNSRADVKSLISSAVCVCVCVFPPPPLPTEGKNLKYSCASLCKITPYR